MPSQDSTDLFRLAVDLCPSGMLAVDADSRILLVNLEVERLFGYTREELIGQSIDMLVPKRSQGVHPGYRASYLEGATSRPMGMGRDLYGLRKDGTEVPVEIGLNPVTTSKGVVVIASVVDITARRRTEEQLRQSQKMEAIGTLAGGVAHDFNNILAGIIGYTELAQRTATAEQRDDLDQVLRAAERGRRLVQRILTFSRQRDIARSTVVLDRPVREALQLLRASLPTTIEIVDMLDPTTPLVLSDETQVHQIVMNLATNAAHAIQGGGRITIELGPYLVDEAFAAAHAHLKPGLYAKLSVRDTGCGMTEAVASRAFEPFFTTKPAHVGTGLGLSVLHGIVASHGGSILLESKVGEGTSVDVLLPAEGARQLDTPASKTKKRHVLVVDDEPPLAVMMKRQIEVRGYAVTAHTSSVDALTYFKAQPESIDLLVTDNTMPRMTGLALVQEVLKIRPDLPIVLVSGLAETADPEALRKLGITRLLAKPHSGVELAATLEELIGPGEPAA